MVSQSASHDPDPSAGSTSNSGKLGEIVVLNRDLFFGVKIGNTLRELGYDVTFVNATRVFVERMARGESPPVLGLIDMNAGVDWEAVKRLNERVPGAPLLVFGSHLDVEGRRAAKAAGVRRVVSNGDFHREMVTLVRRYASAERP